MKILDEARLLRDDIPERHWMSVEIPDAEVQSYSTIGMVGSGYCQNIEERLGLALKCLRWAAEYAKLQGDKRFADEWMALADLMEIKS